MFADDLATEGSQVISSHDVDLIIPEECSLNTKRLNQNEIIIVTKSLYW